MVGWGDGMAARRGKVDGRGRECEGRAEEKERGESVAGLGGASGGGRGCARGREPHAFLFETVH